MVKLLTILLTFLAYSITLVHNLVPHQHKDTHHTNTHHQHENDEDDHHHEDGKNDLGDLFADVIHNPSCVEVIHSSQFENVQKNKAFDYYTVLVIDQELLCDFKPPDKNTFFQVSHYYFNLPENSHLRGPPAV